MRKLYNHRDEFVEGVMMSQRGEGKTYTVIDRVLIRIEGQVVPSQQMEKELFTFVHLPYSRPPNFVLFLFPTPVAKLLGHLWWNLFSRFKLRG